MGGDRSREPREGPGQFTYSKGGGGPTLAMAAAGVVCLQEFGCYDDWRIPQEHGSHYRGDSPASRGQTGHGNHAVRRLHALLCGPVALPSRWRRMGGSIIRPLRDYPRRIAQRIDPEQTATARELAGPRCGRQGRLSGTSGDLYATSVACFILAIPNRFLPILQEGRIESLSSRGLGRIAMNWIPHFSSGNMRWPVCCVRPARPDSPAQSSAVSRARLGGHGLSVREALQRQRRVLQLRDLILLILRTAAVLLFGLALARPYLTADGSSIGYQQPAASRSC